MSKVPLNSQFERVLRFLLSFNNPHVVAQLRKRGFARKDRQEGWELFETATGKHLDMDDVVRVAASPNKELIAQIDSWENTWFDVADAVLSRAFPKVHERLFKNLSKTNGVQVVVTVNTLLNRLAELETNGSEEDLAAVQLLASRGLDETERERARAMLKKVEEGSVLELPSPNPETEKQRLKAIEDMWVWYKMWAQIARTVVTAKRTRITMGISQPGRKGADGGSGENADTEGAADEEATPAEPATQPAADSTPAVN